LALSVQGSIADLKINPMGSPDACAVGGVAPRPSSDRVFFGGLLLAFATVDAACTEADR
jgi:hypothetical protein